MNNSITLIGNSVLQIVGGNVYWFLFIVLSLWLLFWLYKELRKEDWERNAKVVERLDKTLESLGALESSLCKYLNKTDDGDAKNQLYDTIGSSYPYVSIRMIEKIRGVFVNPAPEYGKECIELLRKEIKVLKNGNLEVVPQLGNGEMSTWVERSVATLTSRFIKPFGTAFLILLLIYCLAGIGILMVAGGLSPSQVGELVLFTIAIYVLLILSVFTITALADGKWKQFLKWNGPVLLFPPLLAVVLASGIFYRSIAFVLFLLVIVFIYYRYKKKLTRKAVERRWKVIRK